MTQIANCKFQKLRCTLKPLFPWFRKNYSELKLTAFERERASRYLINRIHFLVPLTDVLPDDPVRAILKVTRKISCCIVHDITESKSVLIQQTNVQITGVSICTNRNINAVSALKQSNPSSNR